MRLVLLGDRRARGTSVGRVGLEGIGQQHFAQHQDVGALTNRVGADEPRLEHAVAVVAWSLIGRGAVEAPDTGLLAVVQDLGLGTHQRNRLRAVDPNVLRTVNHGRSPTSLPRSGPYDSGTVSNRPFPGRCISVNAV